MVGWDTLTNLKSDKWLGLQKASYKNDTMLTTLAWRFSLSTNCLWNKIFRAKYGNLQPQCSPSASRTWKNITRGWRYCLQGAYWLVHKGKNIIFWYNSWIPNCGPLRILIVGPLSLDQDGKRVSEVWKEGLWDFSNLFFQLSFTITNGIQNSFHCNPNL